MQRHEHVVIQEIWLQRDPLPQPSISWQLHGRGSALSQHLYILVRAGSHACQLQRGECDEWVWMQSDCM